MIIDNCLPEDFFNKFVKELTNWDYVPWYFTEHTAFAPVQKDTSKNSLFESSWAHTSVIEGRDNSHLAPLCREAVNLILEKNKETLRNLYRVRFGLITCNETSLVHDAHVDYQFKHRTGLLYINDSDGDTFFYDKFYKHGELYPIQCDQSNVINSVSPKQNRALTFDGWQYHSSSTPTKNKYRMVMNFNYNTE